MRKTNNIIEINGKRYDATTGNLLDAPAKTTKPSPSRRSVDGVKHSSRKPAHAKVHQPAPSQTLMRHAVKKPSQTAKTSKLRAQGHTESPAKLPVAEITISKSIDRLDTKRLQHAKKVHKSQLISRFGATVSTKPFVEVADKPADEPIAHKKSAQDELLERALENATGHEQKHKKQPKHSRAKRTAGIAGAMVLAIGVLGIVTTQNLPNARLQMASAKAGFDAALPEYRPAGYSMGKVNYSDGVVATQFNSNSDQRNYTITQKQTSWDSQALRDSFVAPADANYQTAEANGRTVYIYGEHNATWVNGGIWYQIQSNGSLSDRQLVDLASSL
ncbi:MAG: hypothetical protein AAB436_00060 [Patescibacteria group bacterium]